MLIIAEVYLSCARLTHTNKKTTRDGMQFFRKQSNEMSHTHAVRNLIKNKSTTTTTQPT